MTWHWYGVKLILQAMLTKMSDIIWGYMTTMVSGILVSVGSNISCPLLGAEPLTHPILTFFQIHHKECILINCWIKFTSFQSQKKTFEKPSEQCHLVRFLVNELMRVPFTRSQDWLRVPFTRNQDWLRWWIGTNMASSHYFKQCWPRCLTSYGVTRLQLLQVSWLMLVQIMAVRLQAINSPNADFLPLYPGMYFNYMLLKCTSFIHENAFEMPSAKCWPFCSGVEG